MKQFFKESKETEILEKELAIDEEKIKIDEKRTRNAFLITAIIALVIFINIVIIYSFILKPRVIISEKSPKQATPTPTIYIEPSPTVVQVPSSNSSSETTSIKEYFIPLGSGTSSSDDWVDVSGLLASVDFANYSNIKEIRFEASTQVPTGNQTVWIRLYDKTDNHPVWNSDLTATGASGYSVSQPIIYGSGLKTYQVQAKTQLKFPVNITQSRLHIILN